MSKIKMSKLISESFFEKTRLLSKKENKPTEEVEQQIQLTDQEYNELLKDIKQFNLYGTELHHLVDYPSIAEKIAKSVEEAHLIIADDDRVKFNAISKKKDLDTIQKNVDEITKLCNEAEELKEKLLDAYDKIGTVMDKYFDIEDIK